jgi:hypothetical protein
MKHCYAPENLAQRRIVRIAWATALAVAFTVSLSQPAHANQIAPPPVPKNIQVPPGHKAFLEGHGIGTQNYVCVPSVSSATGVAFVLFTSEATLFDDDDKEVITHFFSPNPFEHNTNFYEDAHDNNSHGSDDILGTGSHEPAPSDRVRLLRFAGLAQAAQLLSSGLPIRVREANAETLVR